jgi:hypothetical protein
MMFNISQYFGLLHIPSLPAFSLKGFSLGSGNIFALLALVCVLLFALSMGRTRTLISLLAVYIAFVLQTMFPFFGWLQKNATALSSDLPTLRMGVFLLAYIVSFILLNRSILKGRFNLGEASFVSVVLIGIVQLGLVVSIILNLAPAYQHYLPASVIPYIANQKALFYWALAPLLILIFQNGD